VEACWQATTSSDGPPDALLRLIPTPEKSSLLDSVMECCPSSLSGTTSKLSTGAPGEIRLMLFPEVFRAKTSVRRVRREELPAHVQAYFSNCSEYLLRLNLALSSPRTVRICELGDLLQSSKNLSPWGMTCGTSFWGLGTSVLFIKETECGFSRTARPHKNRWPTPQASDTRDRGNLSMPAIIRRKQKGKQIALSMSVSTVCGKLNPPWVAWLMGWPIGWTDLKPLETDKFRRWLLLHGRFSQAGF